MKDKSSFIADTLHGSIMLSALEKDVIVTTLFNRLHGISQNSTAYLTFPSNRTKRIEHSFGCMYLCGNIFYSSICNAEDSVLEKFFVQAEKEINVIMQDLHQPLHGNQYQHKFGGIFKKLDAQYKGLTIEGGIYNYYIPANVLDQNSRKVYALLFSGIRIAALLHDIGHPPFSHISENALNILFKRLKAKTSLNEKEQEFMDILNGKIGEKHQLHEEMGVKIASLLFMDTIPDITEEDAKNDMKYQEQLFKILVKEIAMRVLQESSPFFKDMHAAIDGTLDGDRLDYVSRDPQNSGFRLGLTEYDRLITKMKLCEKQSHFLFCPSISAIKTVEDFLMRRWNLYKNIVFHHRVVKTDYLLQNVIVKIAEAFFSDDDESNWSEDSYILPYDISGLWRANKEQPSAKEASYALSQWDDTWLLTILKKSYFETYIDENSYLHDQLEELLTNRKNYISLIKRKEDFEEIDSAVSEIILERKEDLLAAVENLKVQAGNIKQTDPKFDIEGYLERINEILQLAGQNKENSFVERGGFILYFVKRKLFGVDDFADILKQVISDTGFREGELFFVEKEPKTGTSKDLYFYQNVPGKEELVPLNKISNIGNVLNEDLKFSAFFFLYLSNKTKSVIDLNEIRKKIGCSLGKGIVQFVIDKLNSFISTENQ